MNGPGLRTSRRAHLRIAGAVAGFGGLSLAACGAPGGTPPKSLTDAPVTIQFYKRGTLTDTQIEPMLKEWYEKHPAWKVELVQNKGTLEQLTPHIAGGDKIDLLGWYQTVRNFHQRTGIALPMEDMIKRDKWDVKRFNAKELELVGKIDGKIYGMFYAYGGNLTAMFYNRALFKQAGVPEPPSDWKQAWTWDLFRENMRKLTKKSGMVTSQIGITHFGDPITSALVNTDAKWISDDWKKINATDNELLQTLERWADVTTKDGAALASPGVDVGTTNTGQAFTTGRAAIYTICCGPANPAKQFTDAGMDWGFMVSPKMKYASYDMQSNLTLLTKLGAYPDHGWELNKYLIEDNRWGAQEGRVPPFLEDAQTWAKTTFAHNPNARINVLSDSVPIARPVDKIKYHPAGDELYKVIQPVLAEIWKGNGSVRAALPPLQSQLQSIMDQFPMG